MNTVSKNAFFGLLVCFLFFLIIDVCLRGYLYVKYNDSKYLKFHVASDEKEPEKFGLEGNFKKYNGYYKFTPGKYNFYTDRSFSYTVNSLGFRNKEFLTKKQKDIVRICVFGGSSTFGHGNNDDQTYPYYLEKILNLNNKVKKFEVINCGFPAYKMKQIFYLFKNEVILYQPDIVIIYEAWNDAFRPRIAKYEDFLWKLHNFFYYRWMLYTCLLEKSSLWNNRMPVEYSNRLKVFIALAKKNGVNVVLVKQPINMADDNISADYTLQQLEEIYKNTKIMSKRYPIEQHYYVKQAELIGKENDLLVIDPLKIFKKRADFFLDPVHLTAEGNKALAEIIAKNMI